MPTLDWGDIAQGAVSSVASTMTGGLAAGATGALTNALFGKDNDPGLDALDFMNKAFPGTTPLERLGGGGGGAASVANTEKMALKQFQTQKEIAQIGAQAQRYQADRNVDVANIQTGEGQLPHAHIAKIWEEIPNIGAQYWNILEDTKLKYQQALKTGTEAERAAIEKEMFDKITKWEPVITMARDGSIGVAAIAHVIIETIRTVTAGADDMGIPKGTLQKKATDSISKGISGGSADSLINKIPEPVKSKIWEIFR